MYNIITVIEKCTMAHVKNPLPEKTMTQIVYMLWKKVPTGRKG